jgi:hypothetical protein
MESLEECLDILGLADDASWEEINTAYKDLVRVWHPDRFQTDERLRKRAEEQTRLLNAAMETLRKGYKPTRPRAPKKNSPRPAPQAPPPKEPVSARVDPGWQQTFGAADQHTTFVPAPFLVYQRLSSSFYRLVFAAVLGYLGLWLFLFNPQPGREKAAFGCLVSVFAIHVFVRNTYLIVTRSPLVVIDRRGLSTLESGTIGWSELARIWTVIQARTYCLAIRLSDPYLNRQPLPWRWLLKIRHLIRHAHLTIPGSGFDVHPNDVIRAIDLRHLSGDVDLRPKSAPSVPTWARVARLLALLAAIIPIVRIFMGLQLNPYEPLIYLATFAVGQAAATIGTPIKPPKR